MTSTRFLVFAAWSILVLGISAGLLFFFTFGDCFGDQVCISNSKQAFWLIVATAFVIYWTVAIGLFRRWSR